MENLHLVLYPAPRLREQTAAVEVFDSELAELTVGMHSIMIAENGIGLAAPQVARQIKIIVIRDDTASGGFYALVNPRITFYSKKTVSSEEGCLSIPGVFGFLQRSQKIHLQFQNLDGKRFTDKASGLKAVVLQHEIDHLNGILIIDREFQITRGKELLNNQIVT